jgi:ribosome-binding factor A
MYDQKNSIKKARRNSLFMRAIAGLLHNLEQNIAKMSSVECTRVCLSADSSLLAVYLYSPEGADFVKSVIEELKLYRPSMRASLAVLVSSRRNPDIRFIYDDKRSKQLRIEHVLSSIQEK